MFKMVFPKPYKVQELREWGNKTQKVYKHILGPPDLEVRIRVPDWEGNPPPKKKR